MPRPEPIGRITFEEYLALEARSRVRHEFVDGMIFAMAGGTDHHNVIAGNILAAAKGPSCRRRPRLAGSWRTPLPASPPRGRPGPGPA
ncbi:MAG: hypothetical protein C4327_11945 [Meiothermus sp.]